MQYINRLKLQNFRRFPCLDISLNSSLNILVGDNEAGKSTILLALDLVLSGSRSRLEAIGLETIFNAGSVDAFLKSTRALKDLPILFIEAFLNEQGDSDLNGKNNSTLTLCDGITLICAPNDLYIDDIRTVLAEDDPLFPFEFYEPQFLTFGAKPYNGYTRPVRHLFIDSSHINNEYATKAYISQLYADNIQGTERNRHRNRYRKHKKDFAGTALADLNERLQKYAFSIRTTGDATLEADLTLADDGVNIENKGKGQQCFIKTAFALNRLAPSMQTQIVLLEEPENHLSPVNMKNLIRMIRGPLDKQVVISTHNSLIAARLDLRKCVLMNSGSTTPTQLSALSSDTAEFFIKAPEGSLLDFILAKKVILVEGDAEYILLEAIFQNLAGQLPEVSDTRIISVGGTSFKRYLELAALLKIRTAVLRDNDGDHQINCVEGFKDYVRDHIRVFYDTNDSRKTFEVCLYQDNTDVCDELFSAGRRGLTVQQYMLNNKTEAALSLLNNRADRLSAPQYIAEAVQWIRR